MSKWVDLGLTFVHTLGVPVAAYRQTTKARGSGALAALHGSPAHPAGA